MASSTHWIWHYRIAVTFFWPDTVPLELIEIRISLVGVRVRVLNFGIEIEL